MVPVLKRVCHIVETLSWVPYLDFHLSGVSPGPWSPLLSSYSTLPASPLNPWRLGDWALLVPDFSWDLSRCHSELRWICPESDQSLDLWSIPANLPRTNSYLSFALWSILALGFPSLNSANQRCWVPWPLRWTNDDNSSKHQAVVAALNKCILSQSKSVTNKWNSSYKISDILTVWAKYFDEPLFKIPGPSTRLDDHFHHVCISLAWSSPHCLHHQDFVEVFFQGLKQHQNFSWRNEAVTKEKNISPSSSQLFTPLSPESSERKLQLGNLSSRDNMG